jgi:Alkylmercury lyase
MTTNHSDRSVVPDELEVRIARIGLPARSVQDRQAALPSPLQDLHRALLGAFLTEAGPPDLAAVGRLAAALCLEPQAALTALAGADLVHLHPAAGRVRVAYPFSGEPTAHRVTLADGPTLYAMCALDALGIPLTARRSGRINSIDPASGQPITVEVDGQGWRWQPTTTVVLAGTTALADPCGSVADCCCPFINFHATPHTADAYRQAHPAMTAELLGQAEAIDAARRSFGDLLHAEFGHDPAGSPPAEERPWTTCDTTR